MQLLSYLCARCNLVCDTWHTGMAIHALSGTINVLGVGSKMTPGTK